MATPSRASRLWIELYSLTNLRGWRWWQRLVLRLDCGLSLTLLAIYADDNGRLGNCFWDKWFCALTAMNLTPIRWVLGGAHLNYLDFSSSLQVWKRQYDSLFIELRLVRLLCLSMKHWPVSGVSTLLSFVFSDSRLYPNGAIIKLIFITKNLIRNNI